MKQLFYVFISTIYFSFSTIYAQNTFKGYEDGVIVFQLKPDAGIRFPMKKNTVNEIDFTKIDFLRTIASTYRISKVVQIFPEIKDLKLINTYRLEFDEFFKAKELADYLSRKPFIDYAELKVLPEIFLTPNDQYFTTQYQWGLFKIQAQQAWDISTGSSSVIVGVLDNAILTTHPDLSGKLLPGRDVADGDNDPNPGGGNDGLHGTHVSGIVGAKTNNNVGVASIGYNVSILPVKVGRNSDGALTAGYEGIVWAADNGAQIMNMSWGATGYSAYGQNIVNYAYGKGCILVAAAGNDDNEDLFYPAAYEHVISVAATSTNDAKASFSNYGTWIDISAPGYQILSSVAPSGYEYESGTSMASPMVTGLLGLMKSLNPSLSQESLTDCLLSSADNINSVNSAYIGKLGSGRINAYKAMQCISQTLVATDAGILNIISPNGTVCGESEIIPSVTLKNYGSSPLSNISIYYKFDNENPSLFNWQGNLTQGQSATVNLPPVTPSSGTHSFKVYTSLQGDENLSNDTLSSVYSYFPSSFDLPFSETFESGNFSTNNWTIVNSDNSITWDISSVSGTTPGNTAARMNYFNYTSTGQRDQLISPPLNLSHYSSAQLTFKHAYKRRNTSSSDSLIIYVSKDCGINFSRVLAVGESGQGTFATGYTSTTQFTPQQTNDWCGGTVGTACYTVNLTSYAGNEHVVIKFETYNNNGNNLYIDNINIDGTLISQAPTVSFTSTESTICESQTITYTDTSTPAVTSRTWTFEGGSPSTSQSPTQTVLYSTTGTYSVTLQAANFIGSNSSTSENYVTVNPLPVSSPLQQNGSTLSVSVENGITVKWYKNNVVIPGASGNSYHVTSNGNYKAKLTNTQGCSSYSNEIYVDLTGIETQENVALTVYPIPAQDVLTVILPHGIVPNKVIVNDICGKTVISNSYLNPVNISSLSPGIYQLHIFTDTSNFSTRFIKD